MQAGDVLLLIDEDDAAPEAADGSRRRQTAASTMGEQEATVRPELAELRERIAGTRDAGRPAATSAATPAGAARRGKTSTDLCDPDSFEEYGGLVIAAQRARRSTEDLVANTPADGLVAGIGRVNGDLFDDSGPVAPCSPTTTPCWPGRKGR